MEKAIKIAIENGFTDAIGRPIKITARWEPILLNPMFWQCLSVGMGWCRYKNETTFWQVEWHRFIDHLAQNGDINSFFEEFVK
jgi:hypothetical protein